MRITEAAGLLGTSPRMLRYRDLLGLLPPVREPRPMGSHSRGSRPGGSRPGRSRSGGSRSGRSRSGGSRPLVSAASSLAPGHRHFDEDDLAAVAMGLDFERRYDVSPAEVAFGMRVLTEPSLRAELAELGRRIGRIPPPPVRALEFEKERALRLLNLAPRARAAEDLGARPNRDGLTGGGGAGGARRGSPDPSRPPWTPGTDPAPGRSSPRSAPRL